ncbi:MAG TPA: ABC transporter ATP-binding protein [Verrucomicrobiae bacterium]|nr:ABC transporter ATP-binding protein [Verrucomicrobiae bacterium]
MRAPATIQANTQTDWTIIRRLLGLSWHYRSGCIKVFVYQFLLLAMGLTGLGLTGLGIDFIRYQLQPTAKPPHWPFGFIPPPAWTPMNVLMAIAAIMLLLALFRALLSYAYSVGVAVLVERYIVVELRADVYEKLQRLSFRFYDANETGSIINRVTGDSRAVANFVSNVLMQSVIMVLSLAIYLSYMLAIHAKLTLACLAIVPLLWVVAASFSRLVQPQYVRNRELVDRMILHIAETAQGIQTIKGFARERDQFEIFQRSNDEVRTQQQNIFWRVSIFVPTIGMLTQISLFVLLFYGGHLVISGELALGTGMVVFAGLLQQFSGQISNVAQIANTIQQSLVGARRVFEVLDAPVEILSPPGAKPLPRAHGEIRFENVSFSYNGSDNPELQDVNLEVRPGECIAILGATGSGKTTLLSLIPRFYDPLRGRVLIDGTDVREFNLDDLRRNVGLVFQESFLFSNTVAANIAFGHPHATQEEIERAARIAAAHEFITKLPKGYDTLLGEGGKDLSGGQRQRLAIARALLLDPSILLLDDPTAAVDPETEKEILEAVENAVRNRTTFIVANRISTLRRSNRIIVLEDGRIVQMGTHDELVRANGPYRRTAEVQFAE